MTATQNRRPELRADAADAAGADATHAVDVLLSAAEQTLRAGGSLSAPIPTGLPALDARLGRGLAPGDLAVVAGAQGVGKTTLALQVARNVADGGRPATYVCFEHDADMLLERLLVMEANLQAGDAAPTLEEVRGRLGRPGSDGFAERLGDLPGIAAALDNLARYGPLLHLVGARADVTGLAEISAAVDWHDAPGLVVVDYLQKVVVEDALDEDLRVSRIATALKDLALERGHAVLAVSALDRAGLEATRIRARHLKGSVTLAYEADVILVLQHKYDVVARDRLMFDLSGAQEHHQWVVLSVEKNRHGDDNVDLAFRKRLARGHFDPDGHIEEDPLVDERVHVDR